MKTSPLRSHQIVHARKEAQLSQQELAQELQVSLQTLEEWERGDAQPNEHTLAQLAEITGWEFPHAKENNHSNLIAHSVIDFFVDMADWAEKNTS